MTAQHRKEPTEQARQNRHRIIAAIVIAVALGAGVFIGVSARGASTGVPIACPAGVPIVLQPGEQGDSGTWACSPVPQPSTVTETQTIPGPTQTVTETTTTATTVTASSSPTPTPTTPSPTTPVPTTPVPTTQPPGPVVHGRDITATNTGWQAPGAPACPNGLTVFTAKQSASTLGSRSCVDLRGGLTANAAITLTSSRVVGPVGGDGVRLTLNWVTVDGAGSGEYGVYHRVDCFRCNITNASDGVRFSGTNIVESYIRVRQTSSADHNDGIQAYQASQGGSILRSNIDSRPVNAGNCGNAPVFIADGSRGEVVIRDNWLGGGGYTLRLHESATYRVTGNDLTGWCFGPVTTTNAIPGAFLEWSNNRRLDTGALVNP